LEAKLNDYYSLIWAKIKKEWTLPENLPKGKIDLEAVIVVIIEKGGKVQKSWFEKKSGNALYDQMAMRAIKKAEPFPPIPKEFSDETFEIGIRFHPD
jgi:TonB family protein